MNYIILTGAGYWGRGQTLIEAAQNAKVDDQPVRAMIVQHDPRLFEEVFVDEHGGVVWRWTEEAMQIPRNLRAAIRQSLNLGYFNLKIIKGNLNIMTIPDKE